MAWLGALAVGLTLGLLGSGGSILTVPVLVYLVGEPEKLAVAESLGIVAIISLVGMVPFAWAGRVAWRAVAFFGLPGMAGAYLGAYLSGFVGGAVQLTAFAVVMLLAALLMLRPMAAPKGPRGPSAVRQAPWKLAAQGLGVGVLAGVIGVGGGFLIVPALVLLDGLPMRRAVGTSLAIIAAQSISGFAKHLGVLQEAGLAVDWQLMALFGGLGVVGSFVGSRAGAYVPQARLKKVFAVFVLVMGAFVLWENAPALWR